MPSISVPLIGRPTTCRLSSEAPTPSFCISKDLFNQDNVILYVKHESTFYAHVIEVTMNGHIVRPGREEMYKRRRSVR